MDTVLYYRVLRQEVDYLQSQVREHDTGHIRTTISVLIDRLLELKSNMSDQEKFLLKMSMHEQNLVRD